MSRTTRKKFYWSNPNGPFYDPAGRDNKPRCYCCGNTEQKRANKQDRAKACRMNLLIEYPNLPQISNEYE